VIRGGGGRGRGRDDGGVVVAAGGGRVGGIVALRQLAVDNPVLPDDLLDTLRHVKASLNEKVSPVTVPSLHMWDDMNVYLSAHHGVLWGKTESGTFVDFVFFLAGKSGPDGTTSDVFNVRQALKESHSAVIMKSFEDPTHTRAHWWVYVRGSAWRNRRLPVELYQAFDDSPWGNL
jgi:hypothetical protein